MDAHHVRDRRDLSFHHGHGHHGLYPHHDRDRRDHRDRKYSLL